MKRFTSVLLCALLCLTCFCAVSGCGEKEAAPTLDGTWIIQSYRYKSDSFSSQYRNYTFLTESNQGGLTIGSELIVNEKTISFSHDGTSNDTFTADTITTRRLVDTISPFNQLWEYYFSKMVDEKATSATEKYDFFSIFSLSDSYLYVDSRIQRSMEYGLEWNPEILVRKDADFAALLSKIATVKTETKQDGDKTKTVYEVSDVDISSLYGKTFKAAEPIGPSGDKVEYSFKIEKGENDVVNAYFLGEKYEVESVGASAYYSPAVQITAQFITDNDGLKDTKNNFTVFEVTDEYIVFSYTTYPLDYDRNKNLKAPDGYRGVLRLDLVK